MRLAELIRQFANFGDRGKLDPDVFRKCRPIRNPLARWEIADDGSVLIIAPLSLQGRGFAGHLARRMKLPDEKSFELEAVGAFVWEQCDGQHTNAAITKALQTRYKMNRLEAEASLSAFLQILSQRRLITLMIGKNKS